MKALSFVLLLMASVAIVLVGCSDNAAVPVSPTDQSALAPASLEKSNKVDFTFGAAHVPPISLAPPAKMWTAGGVLHITNAHAFEAVDAGDETRLTGTMEHYLSLSLNVITGEGPCHGSFTLTPDPAVVGEGAVWVGTYEGYRSKTNTEGVFALPLKLVAHGRGGTIDGMQAKMTCTLTVLVWVDTPDQIHPPFPAPYYWSSDDGAGVLIQH